MPKVTIVKRPGKRKGKGQGENSKREIAKKQPPNFGLCAYGKLKYYIFLYLIFEKSILLVKTMIFLAKLEVCGVTKEAFSLFLLKQFEIWKGEILLF